MIGLNEVFERVICPLRSWMVVPWTYAQVRIVSTHYALIIKVSSHGLQ